MTSNHPLSRSENLVIQELKDEVLIYDLKINKALCLNQTSALVWNLCNGTSSVSELRQQVAQKLRSPVAEELIWLALEELSKQNLLVREVDADHLYQGVTRRSVIRKIGIASAVSLPLISSITAPVAARAQSIAFPAFCMNGAFHGCPCGTGVACLDPAACLSGTCECPCAGICNCPCDFEFQSCTEGCPCVGECDCSCASPPPGCGVECICEDPCTCLCPPDPLPPGLCP